MQGLGSQLAQIELPVAVQVEVVRLDTRDGLAGVRVSLTQLGGLGQTFPDIAVTDEDGKATINLGDVAAVPDGVRIAIEPALKSSPLFLAFVGQQKDFSLSPLLPPTVSLPGAPAAPIQPSVTPEGVIEAFFAVCPTGTDALVCEISNKQFLYAEQLAILNEQWNGPNEFTMDQAHAFLLGLAPRDPRLVPRPLNWIQDVSWGITDFAIPLSEWEQVLQNRAQSFKVLERIPFPEPAGKDWFER